MKKEQTQNIVSVQDKEGNDFVVQPIQPEDYWGICDLIVANEDRFQTFFPKTKAANLTPDLSKRFAKIKSDQFDQKEEFLFTIKLKESRKIIGLVYIKELDWNKRQGEFAYCIDYGYEGKGVTSKIVGRLSEYAFAYLGLETLQIHTHRSNISSVKVAEKCNFIWVKTMSKSYAPPGKEALDMELYERYHN